MKNGLRPYTKEWLNELVDSSVSYREVLIKAGRSPCGGENYRLLKNKLNEFDIDTSRFLEKAHNKGRHIQKPRKYTPDEIFCKNSPATQAVLRRYIKRYNAIIYECAVCGFEGDGWEGQIALELDHINGDNTDNRLENLRYLCPNCHATTSTYRGRNKKKNKQ